MGQLVVEGAMMMCPMGKAPVPLVVIPEGAMVTATTPVATIMDFVPLENIATFGACSSPANPEVIAALGAPVPCVPAIVAPWAPGAPTVLVNGIPALTRRLDLRVRPVRRGADHHQLCRPGVGRGDRLTGRNTAAAHTPSSSSTAA